MRTPAFLVFVLVACASAPVSEGEERAVFEGYTLDPVREATHAGVEGVAHPMSAVRSQRKEAF